MSRDAVRRREIELTAADGYRLGATVHEPASEPTAAVVIQGATAVARRYYGRLADHLAEQGFVALTFDYRGIGGSLHGPIQDVGADMMDWARLDAPAARTEGARLAEGRPLFVFGHSFGGQALAISPPDEPLAGAVMVGCQLGDIRLWPARLRPWFFFGVGIVIPLFSRLRGYVPGWTGFGEDLPAGVASQWARWCRTRHYVFGARPEVAAIAERLSCPILAMSFSDDRYAPEKAVQALLDRLPNAIVEHRHRRPDELGVPSVGHFGYFRSHLSGLWREPVEWMRSHV